MDRTHGVYMLIFIMVTAYFLVEVFWVGIAILVLGIGLSTYLYVKKKKEKRKKLEEEIERIEKMKKEQ